MFDNVSEPGTRAWWDSATLTGNVSTALMVLGFVAPKVVSYLNVHGLTAEAIGGLVAVVVALVSNVYDIVKRFKTPNRQPITPAVTPAEVKKIQDSE